MQKFGAQMVAQVGQRTHEEKCWDNTISAITDLRIRTGLDFSEEH